MKIAVFTGADGLAASLFQPGTVRIYAGGPEGWRPVRDVPFCLDERMGLDEIRSRTLAMLRSLDGCRHFVARAITGAPLAFFDGMGIVMWRLAGRPMDFLSDIQQRVEQQAARQRALTAPGRFILAGPRTGEFHLNLIEALQSDGALTSKDVLLPFLDHTPFQRLEIICDHLPKWFNHHLPRLHLALGIAQLPDGRCQATIRPAPAGG